MSPNARQVDDILRRLERHHGAKPRARMGELLSLLREQAADALTLARVRRVFVRLGASLPSEIDVWRPTPGATYVLATGGGGAAGRLTVTRSGSAYLRSAANGLARQQMHLAFEVLAGKLARARSGLPDAEGRGHRVVVLMPMHAEVEGDSLGVALCVALVSRWTAKAPRADTASSAAVGRDGRLMTVAGLAQKVAALRRHYPNVKRLVVARDQAAEGVEGIELLRTENVEGALAEHGLALADVRGRFDKARLRSEIGTLQHERVASYDADEWRRHAHRARWLADVAGDEQPTQRARALGFAALFHLHAGDARDAHELFQRLDAAALEALPGGVRVSLRINEASGMIDRDPERAVLLARHVVEAAEELRGEERVDHLGRAHGTLGRALVHAGRAQDALLYLRHAVTHHCEHAPQEAGQSLVHLATGLRHAGQAREASIRVDDALALCKARPQDATPLFAHYERARCRYALGQDELAFADLAYVEDAQARPSDYPRIGCGRYRIALAARQGRWDRGQLERACGLVEDLDPPLQWIAAAGIGEVLVAGLSLPTELRRRLESAWKAASPDQPPEAVLASLVY